MSIKVYLPRKEKKVLPNDQRELDTSSQGSVGEKCKHETFVRSSGAADPVSVKAL